MSIVAVENLQDENEAGDGLTANFLAWICAPRCQHCQELARLVEGRRALKPATAGEKNET